MKLALLAALAATPAMAAPLTSSTCESLAQFLKARVPQISLSGAPMLTAQGCTLRDVTLNANPLTVTKIGSLSIGGDNFALDDPFWVTFDALRLTLDDVRFVPKSGSPGLDWALDLQDARAGIDVTVNLTRIGEEGWRLSEGLIDFPGDNAISLEFSVPNADISSRSRASFSMAGLRVTEARLKVTTHGMFETYVLLPMTSALLADSTDPDADFDALRGEAMEWVSQVPPETLDADAKAALSAFLMDLPAPDGELVLAFQGDPGFGSSNLLPLLMGAVSEPVEIADTLLRGVDLRVTWMPSD